LLACAAKQVASGKTCTSIIDGLKRVYFDKIKPLETLFKFDAFYGPLLAESDFEAKPSVLLLGQVRFVGSVAIVPAFTCASIRAAYDPTHTYSHEANAARVQRAAALYHSLD